MSMRERKAGRQAGPATEPARASGPRPTSRRPGPRPDERVTLLALSLRIGPGAGRSQGLAHCLGQALGPPDGGRRVVLLPGAGDQWPSPGDVVRACQNHGAAVLFERMDVAPRVWNAHETDGHGLGIDIEQIFGTSEEADADPTLVDGLLARCAPGGERTVPLAGVDVGLLCCGENNVLRCAQANGNEVSVRHHPGASLFDHVRVVHNGAHTNMGNWNKLNRRFEYLSRDRRIAVFATNNDAASWGAAVRIYFDGALLAEGNGDCRDVPDLEVEVVEDDTRDRYRGIVVRAPWRTFHAG